MRIAFYAPMKSPDDPEPSGDRRVGRAFRQALIQLGHDVTVASEFRAYEGRGDAEQQAKLRREGKKIASEWIESHLTKPPELWFTYHLYHKAPDLLGPTISDHFGIPYIVGEASHAPKQMNGPWDAGFAQAAKAICRADRIISINSEDIPCLRDLRRGEAGMHYIPPFLEMPNQPSTDEISINRQSIAEKHKLARNIPWLFTAAMMRRGAKSASYHLLAEAVRKLPQEQFQLLIAGDGPEKSRIEADFADDPRVTFLGLCNQERLSQLLSVSDIFVWPAVREGFGMAILEAHAAGRPVIAGHTPGVSTIVAQDKTGRITPEGDSQSFADAIRQLIHAPATCTKMGRAARQKAEQEHSMEKAMKELSKILNGLKTSRAE